MQYIAWFQINSCSRSDDGINPYKEINCYTLENELVSKSVYDINGVFALYNVTDTSKSLLHIIALASGWNIGHIDNVLLTKYRTFSIDSEKVYNFLTTSVSKSFGRRSTSRR